jgi:ParB family transcriptional regulator, chromosome partitioning protein
MAKKRGLSLSSLDVLLSDEVKNIAPIGVAPTPANTGLCQLAVDQLQRGKYQPRRHMDTEALQDLADSIRAQGIIQPLIVRAIDNNQYEIVAGERRWRAAQLAGLGKVPVIIRDISDETTMAVALIENIQREDLNPVEEARALKRLIDEFQMTQQEVAERIGKSRTVVTNLLRILNLNDDVRLMLEQGRIELGHAKVLLGLSGKEQSHIARLVSLKGLTVRETETLVKKSLSPNLNNTTKKSADPNISRLENELAERLGATVALQHNTNGKGRVVIRYSSLDELDGILSRIV